MKFTVKLNILNKEFNIKNIEAENEYSAENKAIYYIKKKIKIESVINQEKKNISDIDFLKDIFNIK